MAVIGRMRTAPRRLLDGPTASSREIEERGAVKRWPKRRETPIVPAMTWFPKMLAVLTLALSLSVPAHAAQCISTENLPMDVIEATAGPVASLGPTQTDRVGRMVAPVSINGQGPFRFIVDTGANRSVISQELATELGLASMAIGEVHSVYGVSTAPIVEIDSLSYGSTDLPSQPLPLLQGPVLAGQEGLLGVDGMAGRRLRLDFVRQCIEIATSRRASRLIGWTTVRGELRFGHLVVMRGRIRDTQINVLVDTGSDTSLANTALREALRARVIPRESMLEYARAYTAGEPVVLETAVALPQLRLGDLEVSDLIAYVGDFHIFRLWQLEDEPTLLIGMDVLRRTRGIAIDYERGTVQFHLSGGGRTVHYTTDTMGNSSRR